MITLSDEKKGGKFVFEKDGVYFSATKSQLQEMKDLIDKKLESLDQNSPVAQSGEHLPYKQGVTGSNPVGATKYNDVEVMSLSRSMYSGSNTLEVVLTSGKEMAFMFTDLKNIVVNQDRKMGAISFEYEIFSEKE